MPRALLAKRSLLMLVSAFALALVPPFVSARQKPNKSEILTKARASYYSLKDQGFSEFHCTMDPNWSFLLAEQRKANPAGIDAAIQMLQSLHFQLSLGLDGVAKVTHNELPAENEQVANGLKQVYGGMEQMATGFFQSWTAFTISPALPPLDSEFQLESLGSNYVLTYKDGAADVTTTMGQDYAISEMRVKTTAFYSTIKPLFKKNPKGFLLSSYAATYRGATAADATTLDVTIDYQEVNGFQLPQEIFLAGTYGSTPFQVKVSFNGCQASKDTGEGIAQLFH